MPTSSKNPDRQIGFWENVGKKIDSFIALMAKHFCRMRANYTSINTDYVRIVRSHKITRILPPSLIVLMLFFIVAPFYAAKLSNNDAVLWDSQLEHNEFSLTPVPIADGEISQKITYKDDWEGISISSISLQVGTYAHRNNARYEFLLKKDNEVIYSQIFSATYLKDGKYYNFNFNPVQLGGNSEYSFVIRALQTSDYNYIAVFYNNATDSINYRISSRSDFYTIVIVASIIFLLIFFIINFLINSGKIKSEFHFLACMVVYIGSLVFVSPVFTVPDEPYHFLSALRLAEYDWSESPHYNLSRTKTHLPANSECLDDYFYYAMTPALITQDDLGRCFTPAPITEDVHSVIAASSTRFIAYIPASLGIMFGKLISDIPMVIFYCGRFFNLVAVGAIIVLALKLINKYRTILLAVVFIPMFLQQAASYSYDGLLNALSLLVIAYGIRFLTMDVKVRKRDIFAIAISLMIIAVIKPPYILVAAPLIFVKSEKFGKYKFIKWSIAAILLTLITASYFLNSYVEGIGNDSVPIVDYSSPDGRGFQMETLISRPRTTIMMFLRTIRDLWSFYIHSAIGAFGWFYFELDVGIIWIWVIFLPLIALSNNTKKLKKTFRISLLLISIVAIILIMLSMLLAWTPRNSIVIEGVQGRYFLPIIPLLMLAIIPQKSKVKLPENTIYSFLGLMTLIFIITLMLGYY